MYASIGSEIPGSGWTFEPKYDGIRVLAYATPDDVKLVTRNNKDKAKQFPEIVTALKKLATQAKRSLVVDGEIVALIDGQPASVDDAVQAAAEYLHAANMPLVYGLSNVTCEAQREAVSLAELVGGVIDSHTSL